MDTMSLKELENAFGVFSAASSGLEAAYAELSGRVNRLTASLARERAEREAREAERNRIARRFDCLMDVLPGAVLVLDGEGQVRQCNARARTLFGDDLTGSVWDRVAADQLMAHGHGGEYDGPGGRRLSLSRTSLHPDPGQVLLFTDVTESRAMDALSEQHSRLAAMGEMAASLAHQIRTPLASAMLYASAARLPSNPGPVRDDMLDRLVGRLRDLERLIDDMLMFARGAGPAEPGIAVAEILHGAVATAVAAVSPGQRVELADTDPSLQVSGSSRALAGAVANLIANALQATGDAGRVCVSATERSGGKVEIRVSDNGPGVPEALRESIFQPFVSGRPDGTGLGLAVVRSVAREHGGDVSLLPAERGACFVIRLPAANGARRSEVA